MRDHPLVAHSIPRQPRSSRVGTDIARFGLAIVLAASLLACRRSQGTVQDGVAAPSAAASQVLPGQIQWPMGDVPAIAQRAVAYVRKKWQADAFSDVDPVGADFRRQQRAIAGGRCAGRVQLLLSRTATDAHLYAEFARQRVDAGLRAPIPAMNARCLPALWICRPRSPNCARRGCAASGSKARISKIMAAAHMPPVTSGSSAPNGSSIRHSTRRVRF